MNITEIYQLFLKHPSISTDSRDIQKNSIFFALKGDNFDGNAFALEALEKGAVYSIVDSPEWSRNKKCIVVENVLATLQQLANYHRKQLKIPVIAITGTNGKTTTKELLREVLSTKYKTIATRGNLNNHIGVPVTLLSIPFGYEMAIVEMGANHLGEIESLCDIAMPNYGLITNIGKAHLEGFGSFEGVVKAKTELYKYLEKNKGTIFVNANNDLLTSESDRLRCNKISYGTSLHAAYSGTHISSDPFLKCSLNFKIKQPLVVQTLLAGSYNLENVLAAYAVGSYFNIPADDVARSIANYQPTNNRSQLKYEKTNIVLCDFYNANPSSMEVALKNFAHSAIGNKKKVIILGAMKELGSNSKEEHGLLIKMIEFYNFEHVYLIGNEFTTCNTSKFKCFEDSESLNNYFTSNKLTDSYILIKGSRATKLEKIMESLKG